MRTASEQVLLQRAKAGEAEAFNRLFVQHKDSVYACLWNLLDGDAEAVEEAVGNVFLNAYRAIGRFRSDAAFSTWLYRIAVNEAHARRRQRKRWMLFAAPSLDETKSKEQVSLAPDPADDVLKAEEEQMLRSAIRALPEPYRTAITLRYISGLNYHEIALILKRPAGTVRYQLSRALGILRERLGSEWQV